MKKTFLARRNALFSAGIPWGTIAFSLLFVVLLVRLLAPNFFWSVFAPVFRVSDNLSNGVDYFISGFKNSAELSAQNERLINENTALTSENYALLQKSKTISLFDKPGIIAGVVARPPESPYDSFVLAVGTNTGVTIGMEAFGLSTGKEGEGEIPIGVVSSVYDDFSRVTLFSAPGIITNGWVGDNKVPVSLIGTGAGTFDASVPLAAGVVDGDIVFVSGPGALPIGKIVRVDDDPSSSLATLRISPILNIFSITWVVLRATSTP